MGGTYTTTAQFSINPGTASTCAIGNFTYVPGSFKLVGADNAVATDTPLIPSILSVCGDACTISPAFKPNTSSSTAVNCLDTTLLKNVKSVFESLNGKDIRSGVINTMTAVTQSFNPIGQICEYQIQKDSIFSGMKRTDLTSYLRITVGSGGQTVLTLDEYDTNNLTGSIMELKDSDGNLTGQYTDGTMDAASGKLISKMIPYLAGYDTSNPNHTNQSIVKMNVCRYNGSAWSCSS